MTGRFKPQAFVVTLICAAASSAWAVEYGTVVSATPVVVAVPVPQRLCTDEPVTYQQPNSGAGALIGAIAGAAIGNSVGAGMGRAAATGIGMVAGAAVGDRVEANAAPQVAAAAQRCRTVTRYENRAIGYDVVYDFQGVRRSTRLAQDPGERIALDINVAPQGAMPQGRVAAALPAPIYTEPAAVPYDYAPQPAVVYAQPGYYAAPGYYGGPVYANPWPYYVTGAVLWGGWGGGGHRHR